RRLGRLLPGQRAAVVDAVAVRDLPGDVRPSGYPARDPRRRRPERAVAGSLAADRDRPRRGPARAGDLPARRAVRQASREAERVGLDGPPLAGLQLLELPHLLLLERDAAAHELREELELRVAVRGEAVAGGLGRPVELFALAPQLRRHLEQDA